MTQTVNTIMPVSAAMSESKPMPLSILPELPLVSILIANYNYEKYLPQALDSVLAQTYDNWETIVCDDGSTDHSREIVERYSTLDSRIRFRFKENGGVATALNSAYAASRGQVICLLDADDVFSKDKVEKVLRAFQGNHNAGLVAHRILPVSSSGGALDGPIPERLEGGWLAGAALKAGGNLPPASALAFRKEVVENIFPLPTHLRTMLDGYLRTVSLFETEAATLPDVLAAYRLHRSNITGCVCTSRRSAAKTAEAIEAMVSAIRSYLQLRHSQRLSESIRTEDWPGYRTNLLLNSLFERDVIPPVDERRIKTLLNSIENRRVRLIWQLAFVLPHAVGIAAYRVWSSHYPGRQYLQALARALDLK